MLYSCESEYQKQMSKARELVKSELRVKNMLQENFNSESVKALAQIREDIAFHAHLSGNELLFMEELNGFKSQIMFHPVTEKRLISKYP